VKDEYGESLRFIKHEENKGAAAARNTGIEASDGRYIAFLDADDRWRPTKLERQYAVFNQGDETLGLVYTGFAHYHLDGNEYTHRPDAAGNIYIDELECDRIHPTSTVMIRQECIDRVGGFDTSLPSRQDYDLWIRITEYYGVDYVDKIFVDKYEQQDSISKDFQGRVDGDHRVLEKVRERIDELNFRTRTKILSYHYHVIGRDYESNGDRLTALKYLSLAILRYPFRPVSWAMFGIILLGIDRNGPFLTWVKKQIW